MSYSIGEWRAPDTVKTGQRFDVSAELCCNNRDQCDDVVFRMFLDGEPVSQTEVSLARGCHPLVIGLGRDEGAVTADPRFDIGFGDILIKEPGTYTLRAEANDAVGSTTVEVGGTPIDHAGRKRVRRQQTAAVGGGGLVGAWILAGLLG